MRHDESCPRPDKTPFTSKSFAKRTLREFKHRSPTHRLRAYKCPCGYWHIGNLAESVVQGDTFRG